MVNKHQAVIDYLLTCQAIYDSPLYFNFISAKDDTNQFITDSNDTYTNVRYVDGSVKKLYTFTITTFKSINDIAIVPITGYPDENVNDMYDLQALIDWIDEQNDARNFPDFGSNCFIEQISTTTEEPKFIGIDEQTEPKLAVYNTVIQIEYIDNSKSIWG